MKAKSARRRIISRAMPLPQAVLSPIRVPVVPRWLAQSMAWMPVVPTGRPSYSITHRIWFLSSAICFSHSRSPSSEGGKVRPSRELTSTSSNQVIITSASSARGGRSLKWLPWITGPYMTRPRILCGNRRVGCGSTERATVAASSVAFLQDLATSPTDPVHDGGDLPR